MEKSEFLYAFTETSDPKAFEGKLVVCGGHAFQPSDDVSLYS